VPDDEPTPRTGFHDPAGDLTTTESLGERLLGSLLDRAHLIPPRLVGPLVAQELHRAGATEVSIHLQDYDQLTLQPLLGRGLAGKPVPIDGSPEGRVFTTDTRAEIAQPDGGVRLALPMLDGSDRVGVLSFTLPGVREHDRQLAHRVAGLVADLVVTKGGYTDTFARVRTTRPMALAAQLQWQSLPPLSMTTPDVDLSGILEPAYEVGGDSFDYALDEHVLHVAVFDAMGHGLEAATMATVVLAAYQHGRRRDVPLAELYTEMDAVVGRSFPGRFATGQLGRLDSETGPGGPVTTPPCSSSSGGPRPGTTSWRPTSRSPRRADSRSADRRRGRPAGPAQAGGAGRTTTPSRSAASHSPSRNTVPAKRTGSPT
jgi:hypothetical protein